MFVDTSAVVAIVAGEPEADRYLDLLAQDARKITGPHVRLESAIIWPAALDWTSNQLSNYSTSS
jgi:uncharacterized protein with PIN domain